MTRVFCYYNSDIQVLTFKRGSWMLIFIIRLLDTNQVRTVLGQVQPTMSKMEKAASKTRLHFSLKPNLKPNLGHQQC